MRDLTRFLAAEDVCDCVDGGVAVDLAAGGGGARGWEEEGCWRDEAGAGEGERDRSGTSLLVVGSRARGETGWK